MSAICSRCAEPLVKRPQDGFCVWCREERLRAAVAKLVAAAKSESDAALLARVEAIDTLRNLGHSPEEVLHARARALDRHSVEEIVADLGGAERMETTAVRGGGGPPDA